MRTGLLQRVLLGTGYLGRGLRMWITSPRLMFLGALPALLVGIVYVALLVALAFQLDAIATALTGFAERWDEPWRISVRVAVGAAVAALALLIAVFTYTALTLALGDPFYERISRRVKERLGGAPAELDEPWWRGLARGIGNALRLLAATAFIGLLLFALGLIPLVGTPLAAVLGAVTGGWFLAVELAGYPFDARGLPLSARRRMLATGRATTLGFGVLTYLLFLVPLGAVVVMPAAVAGATLMSRDALAAAGEQPAVGPGLTG